MGLVAAPGGMGPPAVHALAASAAVDVGGAEDGAGEEGASDGAVAEVAGGLVAATLRSDKGAEDATLGTLVGSFDDEPVPPEPQPLMSSAALNAPVRQGANLCIL